MKYGNLAAVLHFALTGILLCAVSANLTAAVPKTKLHYINGMLADDRQATRQQLNMIVIALNADSRYSAISADVETEFSYNKGHSKIRDLIEIFGQLFLKYDVTFWLWTQGLLLIDDLDDQLELYLLDRASLPILENDPVLQRLTKSVQGHLEDCHSSVILGYSQGTLYANDIHGLIPEGLQEGLGLVSVGTPGREVAGTSPAGSPPEGLYTTIEEDLVVKFIPFALSANVDQYPLGAVIAPRDGHSITHNYLFAGSNAANKIVSDLIDQIQRVRTVDLQLGCGWPAIYADGYQLQREPRDKPSLGSDHSADFDAVWTASQNGTLQIEYRLGAQGNWVTLTARALNSNFAFYHNGNSVSGDPQVAPYVFLENSAYNGISKSILVQPYDVDNVAAGYQEYRLRINGDVIDRFGVDFDSVPWLQPKTTWPIADPLAPGSMDIEEITP